MDFVHKSVLLYECIEGLNIKENGVYVDGTLGGAGHSSEIIKRLSKTGRLIGIDRDTDALKAAKEKLKDFERSGYICRGLKEGRADTYFITPEGIECLERERS